MIKILYIWQVLVSCFNETLLYPLQVHKIADYAVPILTQAQLKRTEQGGVPFSTNAKRVRRLAPTAHATPPQ